MKTRRILLAFVLSVITAFSVIAQEGFGAPFGNQDQPGTRLHININNVVDQGYRPDAAIATVLESSISESDTTLTGEAKSAVAFDTSIASQFYTEMMTSNSLVDATKVVMETNPNKAVHVITLGVVLYPDFAQEIFDGAALTGLMLPEDILVAAIQAGADPSSVSDAPALGPTAAGPDGTIVPLGAGIGAGGTGGGDTTASTN